MCDGQVPVATDMIEVKREPAPPILSWMGGTPFGEWRLYFIEHNVEPYDDVPANEDLMACYQDDARDSWDSLICYLTDIIKKHFSGYWHVKVSNFGWQSLHGEKGFFADKGSEFLQEILPKTDCHFKIFRDDHPGSSDDWADGVGRPTKGLKIQNFHHDSPVGNEWYYLIDVGEVEKCVRCEKWFPGKDSYESKELGYALTDWTMCQKCGEAYYEEEENAPN